MTKKFKLLCVAFAMLISASILVACGGSSVKVKQMELLNNHPPLPSLTLWFKLDKELDLDDENNNIEIAYYTVVDGQDVAIKNNALEDGKALVKDKGWAGFLVDSEDNKYVKGTPSAGDYAEGNPNLLKADTKYFTQLRNGASSDGESMEYHDLDWQQEQTFKVVITITTKSGKSNFEKTFNYTSPQE